MSAATAVCIVGRSSSHFTRLARIFAAELGVAYRFEAVLDLTSLNPLDYAGNPALKLPVLKLDDATVYGVENICRTLAGLAPQPQQVIWPADLHDTPSRNAQELVWHAMQAQVQLGLGTQVAGLPADSIYFAKASGSLRNALAWLDAQVPAVIAALPPHDISMLEASLFCLLEHLAFRRTIALDAYGRLNDFARRFGARLSARDTAYFFDAPTE